MLDLIRTISNRDFKRLKGIAQLSAQQLFHVQDLILLAQAVQESPAALQDPKIQEACKILDQHFVAFMLNNNALVQSLMDAGVLMRVELPQETEEEDEDETPDPDPETPPTPTKPTFTVVK